MTAAPSSSETLFAEMKRYVRFSAEDERALRSLHAVATPHFARIADEFYERVREHERAHDVLTGEEQVERLKRSLVRWMDRALSGPWDEAYFTESAKIGRVHVRIGLSQRYMFTAMALVRNALGALIPGDDAVAAGARRALNKALDLELAIMMETYSEDFLARTQKFERLERAEVDRALSRVEHRYVNAVELARVLVVGLDAAATIRFFNAEARRVTGWALDEIHGMPFVDTLVPEHLRPDHGALITRAAAGEGPGTEIVESAVLTRAGKVRDVRWQLAHAPSGDDEVALFVIGHDTTDENALSVRVRQSEKLAAVGTLAAGLAHEIRNPLNGAQLHVTFLERGLTRLGVTDADSLEAVRVVRDEIRRLGALVDEFLDFARPRPLVRKPTSLRALCERASAVLAADAKAAGVDLVTDLPATDVELDVDPGRIEQVLLNLARNAIEALAPSGSGRVVLRARRQPRHAVVEIEDDGPGVSTPEAPIFDPFFSTKPQGTGLGLAIVHRIVTDHGGAIDFTSRPGKTVFRATLPLSALR